MEVEPEDKAEGLEEAVAVAWEALLPAPVGIVSVPDVVSRCLTRSVSPVIRGNVPTVEP